MTMAFLFLLLVVGLGPEGFHDGLGGPLDKGLAPELVAGVTAVDEAGLAALFGERGDAAVFLQRGGVVIAGAVGTEEGEQARRERGAGAGQALEDPDVLVLGCESGDELVETGDGGLDAADLDGQRADERGVGLEGGGIVAHGHGVADEVESPLDGAGPAAGVGDVEPADRFPARLAEILKGGPFFEEGAGERGEEVAAGEIEGLGEAFLEDLGEFVGEAGADGDELAAFLHQGGETARGGIGGSPWFEVVVTFEGETCERAGVAAVVLGAGGAEALAEFLELGGVDQEEAQEVEAAEEIDEVLAGLLDAEGGGCAVPELAADLLGPRGERLGRGGDAELPEDAPVRVEDADVEVRVGAVDADEELGFHGVGWGWNTRACSGDGFIGMS